MDTVIEAAEDYEKDLVKKNVEEYLAGKKHLSTDFIGKYVQDNNDTTISKLEQNIETNTTITSLTSQLSHESEPVGTEISVDTVATKKSTFTPETASQKKRGKRDRSTKQPPIDISAEEDSENKEIEKNITTELKKDKKSGKKLMDYL